MFKVAIIGKPNVGKSTLFNRLLGKKQAIVLDQPGTTRDRNYGICSWLNHDFLLIDTGGFTVNKVSSDEEFQYLINLQIDFALKEADLILYVVSETQNINNDDLLIAKQIKKNKKPIVLIANKSENVINNKTYSTNWNKLGLGEPIYISAEHGLNIYLVFDAIFKYFKEPVKLNKKPSLTFCIIGKPNVGKSSIINEIIKENKMIVSDIAGTTRDAVDNEFEYDNNLYTIIDTAGLRKRGKLDNLEKFALLRSELAIKRSQFCILVIDISKPISDQDKNVAQLIYDANMPCIILANKIDLIANFNKNKEKELTLIIQEAFKFLPYAQIIFTSAKEHEVNLKQIMNKMNMINDQLTRKVPERILQELIDKAQVVNPPPLFKGGKVDLKKIEQVEGRMPTFVIKVNNVKYLHFSYMRFIENQIKEAFDFSMVPILVYYKDIASKERK